MPLKTPPGSRKRSPALARAVCVEYRITMEALPRHAAAREDPYAWLKDENWAQVMRDPESLEPRIRSWLEARNDATAQAMASTAALQERLFSEFRGRIREDDASVPLPDGPHDYYHRFRQGGQHPIYCRRPRGGGGEDILLDGDAEAEGLDYFKIGAFAHSPDHRHAAYTVDRNGSEIYMPGRTCRTPSPTQRARWSGQTTDSISSTRCSTGITGR